MTKGHKTAKLSAILFDNAEVHPIFDVVKDSKTKGNTKRKFFLYFSNTLLYVECRINLPFRNRI